MIAPRVSPRFETPSKATWYATIPLNGIEVYNGVGNGVYNNWIGTNSLGQFFANANFGVYLQNSSYNTGGGNAWGANGLGRVGQVGGTDNTIN